MSKNKMGMKAQDGGEGMSKKNKTDVKACQDRRHMIVVKAQDGGKGT